MSRLHSCGSLQTGNDGLLQAKGEPEDTTSELQRMKEVGFLYVNCSNYTYANDIVFNIMCFCEAAEAELAKLEREVSW